MPCRILQRRQDGNCLALSTTPRGGSDQSEIGSFESVPQRRPSVSGRDDRRDGAPPLLSFLWKRPGQTLACTETWHCMHTWPTSVGAKSTWSSNTTSFAQRTLGGFIGANPADSPPRFHLRQLTDEFSLVANTTRQYRTSRPSPSQSA